LVLNTSLEFDHLFLEFREINSSIQGIDGILIGFLILLVVIWEIRVELVDFILAEVLKHVRLNQLVDELDVVLVDCGIFQLVLIIFSKGLAISLEESNLPLQEVGTGNEIAYLLEDKSIFTAFHFQLNLIILMNYHLLKII